MEEEEQELEEGVRQQVPTLPPRQDAKEDTETTVFDLDSETSPTTPSPTPPFPIWCHRRFLWPRLPPQEPWPTVSIPTWASGPWPNLLVHAWQLWLHDALWWQCVSHHWRLPLQQHYWLLQRWHLHYSSFQTLPYSIALQPCFHAPQRIHCGCRPPCSPWCGRLR